MLVNTYWCESRRGAPPAENGAALVLGIQDSYLHLILDGPLPTVGPPPSPPLRVTVTTDRNETLQLRSTSGFGVGGDVRRYLYVAVFDLPSPDTVVLNIVATVGDVTLLATRAFRESTSSES